MASHQSTFLMKSFHKVIFVFCTVLAFNTLPAWAEIHVNATGCVEPPVNLVLTQKTPLFNVLNSLSFSDCYYGLAAAWTKPSLIEKQKQQKAELLNLIEQHLKQTENASAIEYLSALKKIVASQDVTGRVVAADLEPFHVEMLPLKNRVITEHSNFYFPANPKKINLIGFAETAVGYDSELSITDIYQSNEICQACEHGWLWLVQPNGEIEKRKAGLWIHEKYYLAPGGWLVSPLGLLDEGDSTLFYQALTQWLATQVIRNEK